MNAAQVFKGISYEISKGKWRARLSHKGKFYRGTYQTDAEEAAKQYDKLAYKCLGPAARPNFELSPAQRAELDCISLADLMASFRTRASRFTRGMSAFRGVRWSHGKWKACIMNLGADRHLGYFANEVDAALAYDAAARILHGAGAKLNFPNGPPVLIPTDTAAPSAAPTAIAIAVAATNGAVAPTAVPSNAGGSGVSPPPSAAPRPSRRSAGSKGPRATTVTPTAALAVPEAPKSDLSGLSNGYGRAANKPAEAASGSATAAEVSTEFNLLGGAAATTARGTVRLCSAAAIAESTPAAQAMPSLDVLGSGCRWAGQVSAVGGRGAATGAGVQLPIGLAHSEGFAGGIQRVCDLSDYSDSGAGAGEAEKAARADKGGVSNGRPLLGVSEAMGVEDPDKDEDEDEDWHEDAGALGVEDAEGGFDDSQHESEFDGLDFDGTEDEGEDGEAFLHEGMLSGSSFYTDDEELDFFYEPLVPPRPSFEAPVGNAEGEAAASAPAGAGPSGSAPRIYPISNDQLPTFNDEAAASCAAPAGSATTQGLVAHAAGGSAAGGPVGSRDEAMAAGRERQESLRVWATSVVGQEESLVLEEALMAMLNAGALDAWTNDEAPLEAWVAGAEAGKGAASALGGGEMDRGACLIAGPSTARGFRAGSPAMTSAAATAAAGAGAGEERPPWIHKVAAPKVFSFPGVVDALVAEYMGLAVDDEDRRLLARDLPSGPGKSRPTLAAAASAPAASAASAGATGCGSLGGCISGGGDGAAGPSGQGPRRIPGGLRVLEGDWREWWNPELDAPKLQSIWYQFPPDNVLWDKTLTPQLRQKYGITLDRLQRTLRGEALQPWELEEIRLAASQWEATAPAAAAATAATPLDGSSAPLPHPQPPPPHVWVHAVAGPRPPADAGPGTAAGSRGTTAAPPPLPRPPPKAAVGRRSYYPTAGWAAVPPAENAPQLWAPPPPEFLHFIASGEMAAAADVAANAAKLLEAASVEPATAAAAAAGNTAALPPLLPPLPPSEQQHQHLQLQRHVPGNGTSTAGDHQQQASFLGTGAGGSGSEGAGDPYGYPISSYNADAILYRAAVETARLAGQPPPPAPSKYTFWDGRTGPSVGPGLRSRPIATPPPWLHDHKEQHKVLRYWSEELGAEAERLAAKDPHRQLDLPEELSREALLASGFLTARDLPDSDSDSDVDEHGRPLPEGAPRAQMEWRADGPGHVPAYRHVRPPNAPLPPPALSWADAVRQAAVGLGRVVPDPLPTEPSKDRLIMQPGEPYPQPVPYFSEEQIDWELSYDRRQAGPPRVRRVAPEEADLVETAYRIMQRSRPGAALQL